MIYFDNSATSRYKPKKMLDEMVKELSDSANGGRSAHGDALKTALKIFLCQSPAGVAQNYARRVDRMEKRAFLNRNAGKFRPCRQTQYIASASAHHR